MADYYEDSDEYQEEETDEDVDHENYKGIYFEEEPGQKFQDPVTGAHFEFQSMCQILNEV